MLTHDYRDTPNANHPYCGIKICSSSDCKNQLENRGSHMAMMSIECLTLELPRMLKLQHMCNRDVYNESKGHSDSLTL